MQNKLQKNTPATVDSLTQEELQQFGVIKEVEANIPTGYCLNCDFNYF
jgi:hypothetical protein